MMDFGDYTLNFAPLIIFVAATAVIVLQMIWGSHYRSEIVNQQLRLDQLEKRLAATQKDKAQLKRGLAEIKHHQLRSEARNAAIKSEGRTDLTYELAVKLARSGIAVDELARTCGLTQGEAELLSLANRARPAKSKAHGRA